MNLRVWIYAEVLWVRDLGLGFGARVWKTVVVGAGFTPNIIYKLYII